MVNLAMSMFKFLTKLLVFWHSWHPWVCVRSDLKQIWAIPPTVETPQLHSQNLLSSSSLCIHGYINWCYQTSEGHSDEGSREARGYCHMPLFFGLDDFTKPRRGHSDAQPGKQLRWHEVSVKVSSGYGQLLRTNRTSQVILIFESTTLTEGGTYLSTEKCYLNSKEILLQFVIGTF